MKRTSYNRKCDCTCQLNSRSSITILNGNPPIITVNTFSSYTATLIVPTGCKDVYQNNGGWKNFTNIVENPNVAIIDINEKNFPDVGFRNYLESQEYGKDNVITDDEIANITTLNVSNLGISDLKGIEYFTTLKKLLCYKNNLTELNLSANKQLKEVDCYSNQIIGTKMDSLLVSLPTLNEGEGCLYLLDTTDEGNICFTSQVSYAKTKGWVVYYYDGSNWVEYEGREPGILIIEEYFPDEVFRNYLKNQEYGKDMLITQEEINDITSIDIYNNEYGNDPKIASLKGIEYFTALISLSCIRNKLSSLDLSHNTLLTKLNCTFNQLTNLDLSKNTALIGLSCSGNKLSGLDVSKNVALTELSCNMNQLTDLDVSKNTALTSLSCHHNKLTSLNVSKNKKLTHLTCADNQLTDIDVSKNSSLTYLYCAYNKLASIDVSKNGELTELACMGNQLTQLDVSKNLKLKTLKCQENRINKEKMGQIIEDLPIQTNGTLCVIHEGNDENVCTKSLVKKANEKGWKVMSGYEYLGTGPTMYYPNYTEYGGSESRDIYIDEEAFPDPYFCEYLKKQPYGEDCIITEEEIGTVTSIKVGGGSGISSLKGIEYFTALETLDCDGRDLGSLDVSKNTELKELVCGSNKLTSLDVSNNTKLKSLSCGSNQLTALDVSNNIALQYLACCWNQLTNLDVSNNNALQELDCRENKLTNLDISKNIALQRLDCCWNELTSLDVSTSNSNLYELDFCGNLINEESMDALIKELPQKTGYTRLGVVDLTIESEGNVCTTVQVTMAKERGWSAMAYIGKPWWVDYEGSAPSGIQGITLEKSPNAPVYDLNGRRLKEPRKGIIVIGGKKVVMK